MRRPDKAIHKAQEDILSLCRLPFCLYDYFIHYVSFVYITGPCYMIGQKMLVRGIGYVLGLKGYGAAFTGLKSGAKGKSRFYEASGIYHKTGSIGIKVQTDGIVMGTELGCGSGSGR